MKNKIFKYCLLIFLYLVFFSKAYSLEEFTFDITNIEILENGEVFKGSNKGTIKTNNGLIIEANNFEYDKTLNIFKADGNVKINDKIKKILIYSDSIIYFKNKEIINTTGNSKAIYDNGIIIEADIFEYEKFKNTLYAKKNVKAEDKVNDYIILSEGLKYFKDKENVVTEGKTDTLIKSKYKFQSEDINFSILEKKLTSMKKSKIEDDESNIYFLEKFIYSLKNDIVKGEKITAISNYNLPKSDKIYFSSAIIDLNQNNFIAKDTEFNSHNDAFGNSDNQPRIKGISSKKEGDITTIKKGVFTSCKKNDKCPPWSIQASEIIHDKKKKQLLYNNAILKIYDVPVLYFPKFFHPDPTVERQTGLLKPYLNNSNILGNSITLPYFYANSASRDFTFTPTLFDENIKMIQTEFREVGKNFNLVADVGLVQGYKSSVDSKKKNINHLFTDLNYDLGFNNFDVSNLAVKIEKVSNDTYLKIFDKNIYSDKLKPKNLDNLKSEVILKLYNEEYSFETGFQSFENLTLSNNDRYEYVLPYYNYSKNLSENTYKGTLNFRSSGSNELKNTNQLKSKIINDITYNGQDIISNFGIKNNININFKNLISAGKNDSEYRSNADIKLMGDIELLSSLPLTKSSNDYKNYITPKISFRFNPNKMKNYSTLSNKINVDNIFSNNRIGVSDTLESGQSLTVGVDYKKEKIKNINKYFEMKLATVFREEEENEMPKSSTLNKKNSNLYGSLSNRFSEFLALDYNFSLDNDYKTFDSNEIIAKLNVNNFATEFNFIKENGKTGDTNILENQTIFSIDQNNFIKFNTRRNRKINLTEYYNLVYEYKNDCLVAGIKYNKTYYEDRDLKPSENLFFTITLHPLTKYEQKFDQ